MAAITIQGHDRYGWDTETVHTMNEVHAYLRHAHRGEITVYVNDQEFTLPQGIGNRE